jgi:hypothetical protein
MADVAKELIWLQYLLKDLRMLKYAPKVLFCDNQGAISLAKNPTHNAKTKHVDVQLHFIGDHLEKGTFNVEYCPTEDMLADLMMKGLVRERHGRLLGLLGMGTREVVTTTPCSSELGKKEDRAPESRVGVSNYAASGASGDFQS